MGNSRGVRTAFLVLVLALAACSVAPRDELAVARQAGGWKPVLGAIDATLPGPPAGGSAEAEAERVALATWETRLASPAGARDRAAVRRWTAEDPARLWAAEARRLVGTFDVADPARAARVLAYVQVAASDALIATWAAKARYARPAPGGRPTGLPSYPSEVAAVAVACGAVLGALLPDQAAGVAAMAAAVAEVPVAAGLAFPSDVAAGRVLGDRVAALALARLAVEDGAARPAPLPGEAWPLSPEAGSWEGWTEGAAAMPPPPPDGATTMRELAEVLRANRAIGIRERALALKWHEGDMARHWSARAAELCGRWRLTAPEAGRVLAFTGMALGDAAIASFRAQYQYRRPRPIMLAPALEPVLATPAHPGYPADGAALAIAAAGYLQVAFPAEADALAAEGREASEAGVHAGWELSADAAAGRVLGAAVAAAVVARAAADGQP